MLVQTFSKQVCRSPYRRAEMYAGRVIRCPKVSHVEYAPRDLSMLEKDGINRRTDRRRDGRQTVTLRLPLDVVSVMTHRRVDS